jgi:hypothetical protein
MDFEANKGTVLNEIYVKRYKDFIRLVRISKMLSKAKIISHTNQK